MLQDHAIEQTANHLFFVSVEAADGLELEAQIVVGSALNLASLIAAKKKIVGAHAKRGGEIPDDVEGRLRRTGFVSFQLLHVDTDAPRQMLLGEAFFLAQGHQALRKVHT